MYKALSLALLAFVALTQAAPGAADPRAHGVANIEARKNKVSTIGYTTSVYTTTVTTVKPVVTTIKKTKTTKVKGKKTTVTVTSTSTVTQTSTSTVLATTTVPILSTVTTTTTAAPSPTTTTTTLTPTTTAASTTTTANPSTTTAASTTTTATTTDTTATTATSPSAAPSNSCQGLSSPYTDSNGRTYTNYCGTDAVGGDLARVDADSFQACYAICDSFDGCVGFVFAGQQSSGPCYLKSTITTQSANDNVDLAVLQGTASTTTAASTMTSAASTTTTAAPSTTSTTAAPTSTGNPSQSRSCSQLPTVFTDSQGRSYTNTCGTDAYGGDLSLVYTNSFEDCYTVCDGTDGCVGFVYGGGSGDGPCYLKSSIQPASANANEDFAMLN